VSEPVLRVLFVVLCGAAGLLPLALQSGTEADWILGVLVGLAFGLLVVALEQRLRRIPGKPIFHALLGLILGLLVGRVVYAAVATFLMVFPPFVGILTETLCVIGGGYLGALVALDKGREFNFAGFIRLLKEQPRSESYKLLDTSVIIDGRIADITETGFLEGTLVIPQFILRELQHIADSSDPLKRNRGRRGLDILQKIQKKVDIRVEISEVDFPEIREVDNKLVAMAKTLNA
jgi:uncharacterized protein YacL